MNTKLAGLLLVPISIFAQTYTGSISGRVTDASGLAAPGVRVTVTESSTNAITRTETNEVGDYMVLGSTPTRGVLSNDGSLMYVSDTAGDRVTPVDILNRRIIRDPGKGFPVPAGDEPTALRFDPNENLLLVVSHGSGDLAVIRVRTNFLVTMIPVGDHPQELAVKLF